MSPNTNTAQRTSPGLNYSWSGFEGGALDLGEHLRVLLSLGSTGRERIVLGACLAAREQQSGVGRGFCEQGRCGERGREAAQGDGSPAVPAQGLGHGSCSSPAWAQQLLGQRLLLPQQCCPAKGTHRVRLAWHRACWHIWRIILVDPVGCKWWMSPLALFALCIQCHHVLLARCCALGHLCCGAWAILQNPMVSLNALCQLSLKGIPQVFLVWRGHSVSSELWQLWSLPKISSCHRPCWDCSHCPLAVWPCCGWSLHWVWDLWDRNQLQVTPWAPAGIPGVFWCQAQQQLQVHPIQGLQQSNPALIRKQRIFLKLWLTNYVCPDLNSSVISLTTGQSSLLNLKRTATVV